MTNKNHLEMLLNNFRLPEATGYVSALVEEGEIPSSRGKTYESFLRAYGQVICDSLWNEEGILILSACNISDTTFNDIENEKKRLIDTINEWLKNDRRLLLFFVSAYYAVSNVDSLRMKLNLDKIMKEIKDEILVDKVSRALGGYERFQAVANALENYCHLDESALDVINTMSIQVLL